MFVTELIDRRRCFSRIALMNFQLASCDETLSLQQDRQARKLHPYMSYLEAELESLL
jgi:hypothetical protein